MSGMSEIRRGWLKAAMVKLRNPNQHDVRLYVHEAEALYDEFCRLANFATLLGEPSPAEMAGIYTREECEEIAARFLRGEASPTT